MRPLKNVISIFALSLFLLSAGMASGQTYPNKPIRIVVSEPGGGTDVVARLIAPGLTADWGQQIVIENRGGSGVIPALTVAKASPDGHTLLLFGSTIWLLPYLQDNVPYDPVKDFSPITLATNSPSVLVVHSSVPAKSIKELIALAKAQPTALNYGTSGPGSANHLAAEMFKAMAGVNIVQVNYKGTGPAIQAVLSNQVQMIFGSGVSVGPHVKAGRLNALAMSSAQPSALFPGLPTIAASGLPGYESGSMQGIWAPAKTPAAVVKKLNQELVRVLNQADVKQKFFDTGADIVGSSPEEFAAKIKSEMARWSTIIKNAGIHAD